MAYSLNAVQFIGRTGREPEMRYASTGKPYTTFSLATDRRAKSDGQPGVDWHTVICWDKLAEFANQYLRKGRLLYVGGRLSYRVWTGQDGQPHHVTEIVASEILLLDRRPQTEPSNADAPAETEALDGDDLPF